MEVGYDNEIMDILIFKTKNSFGKVSSVLLYPGANYYRTPPEIDEVDPPKANGYCSLSSLEIG